MYSKREIVELLKSRGKEQQALFKSSRKARHRALKDQITLRGVIEITNTCRVNCHYCPMRRDNAKSLDMFSLTITDIIEAASHIATADFDVVFIQGGEAPQTTRLVGEALPHLPYLCSNKPQEILLNLGNKSKSEYEYLKAQGATGYILKHETSDPVLHKKLREETLKRRLDHLKSLLSLGYKVGTGTIIGLPGQRPESIADDILLADDLGVHMSSASPFIPAAQTPLANDRAGCVETTLNAIAVMRLINPTWLIPSVSALEKLQPGGQLRGLEAGADVLTVNFTPRKSIDQYRIYGSDRFVVSTVHVARLLEVSGMTRKRPFDLISDERL